MKGTKMALRIFFSLMIIACVHERAHAASATVTVDYSKPKQTIAGFGASITWVAGDLNSFAPLLHNHTQRGIEHHPGWFDALPVQSLRGNI
jgi:O-glycosyl hydrolase